MSCLLACISPPRISRLFFPPKRNTLPGAAASLHGGVFPYTDAEGYIPGAEKAETALADKLPVGHKGLYLRVVVKHEVTQLIRSECDSSREFTCAFYLL